jgi:hypothetical protein
LLTAVEAAEVNFLDVSGYRNSMDLTSIVGGMDVPVMLENITKLRFCGKYDLVEVNKKKLFVSLGAFTAVMFQVEFWVDTL